MAYIIRLLQFQYQPQRPASYSPLVSYPQLHPCMIRWVSIPAVWKRSAPGNVQKWHRLEWPDKLRPWWEQWKDNLINKEKVGIKCCYAPPGFWRIIKTELHNFSDASTSRYGQCSFLRLRNEDGDVHCAQVKGNNHSQVRTNSGFCTVSSSLARSLDVPILRSFSGLTPWWFWDTSTIKHANSTQLWPTGCRRCISTLLLNNGDILTLQTMHREA